MIKYHNDMNTIAFGNFKEKELDLFFSICFKARDLGAREVEITFDELKELSNYSNRNIIRFVKDLESTYDKMLNLNIKIKHSEIDFEKFNLFNRYKIMGNERKIIIKVSDEFEFLLNKLIGNYTKFDLIDFVNLKSSYSKNMFKLLKQWDSVKEKKFELEELKFLLGVPEKYKTADFNKRVLTPIMKELPYHFKKLKLEKIKTGKKITHLKFNWARDVKESNEVEVLEIEISEKLNKKIENTRKNKHLKNILNEKIIASGIKEAEIKIKVKKEKKQEIEEAKIVEKDGNEDIKIHYKLYENMPADIKESILEKAKEIYLRELKIKSLNKDHEKLFEASKKNLIMKILKGEE